MVNILIGCTGSVATIKLPKLIRKLFTEYLKLGKDLEIRLILTEKANYFVNKDTIPDTVEVVTDASEWVSWKEREDHILHIDLGKWADLILIAPLDANTLAKIAGGLCDNLLTSTIRAWDMAKPLIFCPAMNTRMYDHPLTASHREILTSWGYIEIPVVEKKLMCGDTGVGGMAEVSTIVKAVKNCV